MIGTSAIEAHLQDPESGVGPTPSGEIVHSIEEGSIHSLFLRLARHRAGELPLFRVEEREQLLLCQFQLRTAFCLLKVTKSN